MFIRLIMVATLVATCLGASGCATTGGGTTQGIVINTDPQGANCSFTRDNILVAQINSTPGVALVTKAFGAIGVLCKKAKYQDLAVTLESKVTSEALNNFYFIFAGLYGVAVDAASGAMYKYPASLTFTLIPVEFATAAERDAFFARMSESFEQDFKVALEQIQRNCGDDCENKLRAAEVGRKSKLAEIEERRLLTNVQPGS